MLCGTYVSFTFENMCHWIRSTLYKVNSIWIKSARNRKRSVCLYVSTQLLILPFICKQSDQSIKTSFRVKKIYRKPYFHKHKKARSSVEAFSFFSPIHQAVVRTSNPNKSSSGSSIDRPKKIYVHIYITQ